MNISLALLLVSFAVSFGSIFFLILVPTGSFRGALASFLGVVAAFAASALCVVKLRDFGFRPETDMPYFYWAAGLGLAAAFLALLVLAIRRLFEKRHR